MDTPVISASRNPFEIYILIALMISGVAGIVSPRNESSAVAHVLPLWELYILYSGFTIGSIITLYGIIGKKIMSLYVERIGLILLTGATLTFAVAVVTQASRVLALPIITTIFLSVACFVRLLQINRELKAAKSQ